MVRSIINKIKFFNFLLSHPLNKGRKIATLLRYFRWQVSSRLALGAVAIDYVNNSRLLVAPGMTGATMNIYTGLHEFEDMAFVLHCLRKNDVFVDIGANIGSYSVLAGSAVGVTCIAIEPIPDTFKHLQDNINLNEISDNVTTLNIGIGESERKLKFTTESDTVNHVLTDSENQNVGTMDVPVKTLDDVLLNIEPTIIKIDVEGFETNVIKGAKNTLSKDSLLGVIMELNGSGDRYGFDELSLHNLMLNYGFLPYKYSPFSREIISLKSMNSKSGNTLYIKHSNGVRTRLIDSQKYQLQQVSIEL